MSEQSRSRRDEPDTESALARVGLIRWLGAAAVLGGVGLLAVTLLRTDESPPAEPSAEVAGSLNTSCFAFRDVDADGRFDLDDRPYAGLAVAGEGPGGSTLVRSNANGFANFPMLLGDVAALVNEPGTYRFEAEPPAGWRLTTGSTSNEVEFAALEGSPVGIVAVTLCEPYGLAPILTISGSSELAGGEVADVSIESESRAAEIDVVDGRFAADVAPGSWTVAMSNGDTEIRRVVEVAEVPVVVSSPVDFERPRAPLETAGIVVGFDDVTVADTVAEIPNGLGGLEWSNWVATHRLVYGGTGYVNAGTSGEFVAYTGSGSPARISSEQPFDFVGAFMGVAWPQAEAHPVTVRAWRNGDLVHDDSLQLSTSGAVYFDADYRGIDEVEIASTAGWQVIIDDAEFRIGR